MSTRRLRNPLGGGGAERRLGALLGLGAGRPWLVCAVVALLAVGGGVLAAVRLEPRTTTDTLVGRGTDEYQASADYHRKFGDDAVYVLIKESLDKLVLTSDLSRVIALEGCLAGNAPASYTFPGPAGGPCDRLRATKPAQVVFGPGTFINTSVNQIQDELQRRTTASQQQGEAAAAQARAAAKARGGTTAQQDAAAQAASQSVQSQALQDLLTLANRYGLSTSSLPSITNPSFVSALVFDAAKPPATPKERFAYIFPSKDAALVQIRLKPGLSPDARDQAIANLRDAVAMPDWRLPGGGSYTVTGAPVLVSELTTSISDGARTLLGVAILVMALVLAAVFRTRRRLLPLLVALAATGITFGILALVQTSLTIATIAVLPVLIGLGVDYAIQLQSRMQEERAAGARTVAVAARRVAGNGAPTVFTAAAATAVGFLVLLLSPVPMVRGFGLLVVVGVAVAFVLALTLGTAGLAIGEARTADAVSRPADGRRGRRGVRGGHAQRGGPSRRGRRGGGPLRGTARGLGDALRGAGGVLADAGRGAEALVFANPVTRRIGRRAQRGFVRTLGASARRPQRVVAVAGVLALVGWVAGARTGVESDIQRLVPQDLPALQDLQALQKATGVGGEVDVVVESDKLTDPAVFRWMADYQQRVLKAAGYSAAKGCGDADLCPALALPTLFRGDAAKTQAGINRLLDVVPQYFSQGVITKDRKTASLAFGIRFMSVERQADVIDAMRKQLDPPAGVRAQLAGLPVLTAEANEKTASPWRRTGLLLAGLLAVGVVLLLALRSWQRALVPLVPIALATGWSGLVLDVVGIDLNPMSVTLGALVVAISTEFSVLLAERFRRERLDGRTEAEALARAYRSTGAAVLASGVTAIAGFAVLIVSDIRMLRDFGAVTVIDLSVSLLGVLVVLPAVLVLADRGALERLRRPALRRPQPPAVPRRVRQRKPAATA